MSSTPELKLGLVGLDTSHVIVFSDEFNNPEAKHHIEGARVVAAYPGGSPDLPSSIDRVPGYTKDLREKYGVQIMDSIEAVVAASDAILHTSLDGRTHLEQFKRIAAAGPGKPVFVDKPFALSTAVAKEIFAIAAKHGCPIFTSSSLRFTGALTRVVTPETRATVKGAQFHGPAAFEKTNPGFYWYGIHPVEMLYTTMGTGCRSVRCVGLDHHDIITGIWADGRIGTVQTNRTGNYEYTGLVHFEKNTALINVQAETKGFFTCLAESILEFFRTGTPPVAAAETIELIRFIEAANESRANDGREVMM
ncbi:MAG: Gfo/Idh/MocA family oxidoreductase [Opitutaceae bacterium]|nr:Gfo/Idh/MocA family oxidoreductase [Cephaloticoccus sp.]MCP5529394.1 Gfo/Idh/MocA family oxidoreductase [Opitutaceae bacterium]